MYVLEVAALIVFLGLGLVAWQHLRYRRIRSHSAEDAQAAFHGRKVFHLILYFRVCEGERVIETAREFWHRIRDIGDVRLIYAGHTVFNTDSKQLPNNEWSGLVVLQYPNRATLESPEVQACLGQARDLFAASYLHGMQRNRWLSLAIPQVLLGIRIRDLLHGRWRLPPQKKLPAFDTFPEYDIWRQRVSRLRASHTINPGGLVTYYLVRTRNPRALLGGREYSAELLSRTAALGHGPLHLGRPRALEGEARFDHVFAVHSPSASYFADLVSSDLYQGIVRGQHLVDSMWVPTVPVTAQVV